MILVRLNASPKIKNPNNAPPPGTAARIAEVLAVPIDRDACAINNNPIRFGTNP